MKTFREALNQAQRTAPPTGDVMKGTGPMLYAVDDLAGVPKGNPEYFHLLMAGARHGGGDGEGT
jgi:hypothetical protein